MQKRAFGTAGCRLAAIIGSWLVLTAVEADELPGGVRAVLEHRDIPDAAVSIQVQNLTTGETGLAWNIDTPRNPASVMKVVTTLVALDMLGPTYTWKTEAYLLGALHDSRLDGDLLLKGYGDPYLVTERLWQLQRDLRALGLNDIRGDLLIDDSFFESDDRDPGAFDRQPLRAYNVAPNALMMNYKVARFQFKPAGESVDIRSEPALPNLSIINRLRAQSGPCRGYRRGIRIDANESRNRFEFSGNFPAGCRVYSLDRAVLDHNAYAFGIFKSLWLESGGRLEGGFRNTVVPQGAEPDLVFESLPLAQIVAKVNKHSNNVMARQLLYTLAAEAFGPPANETKGRAVIASWLERRGMKFPELKLANGAGLSRDSRITARHLATLLEFAFRSRFMPEFLASLPLAGMDGTLRRRMESAALQGRGHMKTGSLDHVSAIAGYLLSQSGDRYSVVVMINHADVHRGSGDEVQEALLSWVQAR